MDSSKQHTLKEEVSFEGIGIHSGVDSKVNIKPADPGFGLKFKRVDLPEQPLIKADVDYVVSTSRSTTLEQHGARVGTVEHLLSALVGLQIDNALIEVNAPEIPIIDGSARPFVEAIQRVGLQEQEARRVVYEIDEIIEYTDPERRVELTAIPHKDYRVTTLIDFNSKVLGTQHAELTSINRFAEEIAPSRTFCFLHELEYLIKNDLIKGGGLDNAIVIVDQEVSQEKLDRIATAFNKKDISIKQESIGILNNVELHAANEPARHKLLDVIGDLALVGYPIHAHIIANRPGHQANVAFAKKIKEYIIKNRQTLNVPVYDPNKPPLYDIPAIQATLPHRHPFLLVDKIIEIDQKHVVGIKNISFDEFFFKGHFPGNPIMPGVLQIEALAQAGGILALNTYPDPENYDTYFLKIDKCKFKRKVIPGDTMILSLELLRPIRRGICEMQGTVYVGNQIATEALLVAQLVRREERDKKE